MRPNDFLARPELFHGGETGGVASHPGFHTAAEPETTFAYAQQKAVPEDLEDELDTFGPDGISLSDYPVVVALDMRGLEQLPDYDDEVFIRDRLVDEAQQILSEQDEQGFDVYEAVRWACESSEDEFDLRVHSFSVVQWLFKLGAHVMHNPLCSLSGYVEDIEDEAGAQRFLEQLAKGKIEPVALAEIGGQFRYLEDVASDRIVTVDYMKPIFPRMFYRDDDDYDQELDDALTDAGWSVWHFEDALLDEMPVDLTTVYERKAPKGARIEYHGTTYRNLLLAAPELELPDPPSPY